MSCFNRKHTSLVIICLLTATYAFGQIKVSEFLQDSKIASADNNKLYFVDFWATWCAPCITAKEHLGVLQKKFPDELYIISVSKENPLVVERFLNKKVTELAVAMDYNGETFKKHNVKILPDGVLYNARGEVLWQGGAPDLKDYMISNYLRKNKTTSSLDQFAELISVKEEIATEYIPKKEIEVSGLTEGKSELQIVDNGNYLKLNGSLSDIISYLARIYKNQIEVPSELNKNYQVYFKKPYSPNENLAFKFITELGLGVDRQFVEGEVMKFTVESPRFWDTDQINWGINNPKFLVGDSQIQGDNVSLRDVAYQLAYVLDMPVIVPEDTSISLTLHDWDIHYKFYQLMQSDLEDNFGIRAEKKKTTYPVYHILKKAP
ncbi:TlpA family protein disulfide reductase [Winogradskyella vincentii]|uniref:TlpA family protein disulfide reductase n=1 Tax=Winogradskyella vincentii TaxID=2877122 RepID=A0ABS7Y4N4_9FLAO|nr:TlpA disulfide reductase family protein [Winogradskyella vincentii]MCA0153602.1 TlpA family protein disulfide reductase [Winogradskyella vincentii]